jgi:hypothetical protein
LKCGERQEEDSRDRVLNNHSNPFQRKKERKKERKPLTLMMTTAIVEHTWVCTMTTTKFWMITLLTTVIESPREMPKAHPMTTEKAQRSATIWLPAWIALTEARANACALMHENEKSTNDDVSYPKL